MAFSVVIRARNEREGLAQCLPAIRSQSLLNSQNVEIVLIDNASTDGTHDLAEIFECKYQGISQNDFTYGRALNLGIRATTNEFVAILSAHCIPVNDRWLMRLFAPFRDMSVAGVFGRQEPLPDSHDFDKRDLWITFGVERRIQKQDPFFHNANAMIRRSVWEQVPFDEELFGQEDRAWAKRVLKLGYSLAYEPKASAFHFHGIHQGRDVERAKRVVKVIQLIEEDE